METTSVPPGFRFHPTDEELVGYYLRKKVASQKIDLDVIRDIDLYRIEPWDLQDRCGIGRYEEQNEWYFFSHKDKKYPTGTRTNRATMAGFWKATGRDKAVYDKSMLIGMRKTLVFYKGRAPNGQKTDWIMHEYRLESDENGPPQEEGWVVCRAFKKKATAQTKSIEAWESSYFFDEASTPTTTALDPLDYIARQQQSFLHNNLLCKQEINEASSSAETLSFIHSVDQFIQLPHLESPNSLPNLITKKSQPAGAISSETPRANNNNNNNNNNEDDLGNNKKVTDWRALDKFVASQLSQEDGFQGGGRDESCSDMAAFLLLQSGRTEEEGISCSNKLSDFLTSNTSDCDIGICVFDK